MKTTVTFVRVADDEHEDVWVDVQSDEGAEVDLIEALGIIELGKHLLIEQAE